MERERQDSDRKLGISLERCWASISGVGLGVIIHFWPVLRELPKQDLETILIMNNCIILFGAGYAFELGKLLRSEEK